MVGHPQWDLAVSLPLQDPNKVSQEIVHSSVDG